MWKHQGKLNPHATPHHFTSHSVELPCLATSPSTSTHSRTFYLWDLPAYFSPLPWAHSAPATPVSWLVLKLAKYSCLRAFALALPYSHIAYFSGVCVCVCVCVRAHMGTCMLSRSIVSNSLWPHGLQLSSLLCLWDFPSKNTGVGCHFLLQGIFFRYSKLSPLTSSKSQTPLCKRPSVNNSNPTSDTPIPSADFIFFQSIITTWLMHVYLIIRMRVCEGRAWSPSLKHPQCLAGRRLLLVVLNDGPIKRCGRRWRMSDSLHTQGFSSLEKSSPLTPIIYWRLTICGPLC